jgi:hypothetical protein
MVSKVDTFCIFVFLLSLWRPPRRYGASSRLMAASSGSGVALDMLHREMPHVSLQRLTMAIEMARNGGAFVRRRRLFRLA